MATILLCVLAYLAIGCALGYYLLTLSSLRNPMRLPTWREIIARIPQVRKVIPSRNDFFTLCSASVLWLPGVVLVLCVLFTEGRRRKKWQEWAKQREDS